MGRTKMPNGLTPNENNFVRSLVKTGNATEAILTSYNTKSKANAHAMAGQLLRKPRIKKSLEQALRRKGMNEDKYAEYLTKPLEQDVRFTGADYLKSLELTAKFMGWDRQKSAEQSYKLTIQKLPTKELKMELTKRTLLGNTLITELENL